MLNITGGGIEKYKSEKVAEIIKEYSRKKFGRKKKFVDMEIETRL
jgi:phage replication-related protein YjqB (UPF0714/DUF867 family)